MHIVIESIPASHHRYPTVGDWWKTDGYWLIRVTQQKDWRHELLVAIHELVEMAICEQNGVAEEAVTAFDIKFEQARAEGLATGEPGDDPGAPYQRAHRFAENIERQIAHELDVVWSEYEATLES